jgi:hypothetical protein
MIEQERTHGVRFYDTYDVEAQHAQLVAQTQNSMGQILREAANK